MIHEQLEGDYDRGKVIQRLVLSPGERRGYWRHYVRKEHRQTIVPAKIDDRNARVLLDSGAEVSILDSDFARKSGIEVDTTEQLACAGVGGAAYRTEGRARVKLKLGGELVYEFDLWVGHLGGVDALLGIDFMEPAGVRLDLVEGVARLPDEVQVRFEGRRALYSEKVEQVRVKSETAIYPGRSLTVRVRPVERKQLWVRRDRDWIATAVLDQRGAPVAVKVSNVAGVPVVLHSQTQVGLWLAPGSAPRQAGYVSLKSRKYREWKTLVYESEPDPELEAMRVLEDERLEAMLPPAVERRQYTTPTAILKKPPSVEETRNGRPSGTRASESKERGAVDRTRDYVRAAIAFVTAKSAIEALVSGQLDETVFIHEGGDLTAEEIEGQMALIPEVTEDTGVQREDIQVARGEDVTEEMIEQVRSIVWSKRDYLMGKGNALPLPAKGVVCDIDVGGARPVAQRCRKVPPKFVDKLYDVLKDLLRAGFIAPSTSQWASPIVIVLKKNGEDIRLCIDYRVVNGLTKLMVYPMPVVHDLLENLGTLRWLCSLDMASGFWVVQMTARARAISAFVTPFGLFEWTRMPFGLKNAPQIYQRLLDNALYGYLKLTPKHLHEDEADVFKDGEPAAKEQLPTIGRRSYIDDILFGGSTWAEMCEKLERLMDACAEWGLSISLPKSEFGMSKVDYLGHRVSQRGIEANPKNLHELVQLEFPRTVKGIQSFLGSLNYYHRFIEHFGVYAAALYEVTPADLALETETPGHLAAAKRAFGELQRKLAEAPILRHFDGSKTVNVAVYSSTWAIAATLLQEHDGQLMPVRFFSRVLKPHEIHFSPAEREVLALLHVLTGAVALLAGREIHVLTRHSTLAWLFQAKGLQGRLEKWATMLSPWSLIIRKITNGEDGLTGLVAAAAGPADRLDDMLQAIQPRKKNSRDARYQTALPTLRDDEEAWVLSFDGSAKPKRSGASCSAVLWHLPEWKVKAAASWYWSDGTVNEAEYRGAIRAFELAAQHGVEEVIVFGDSRIVIQQLRGEIECRTPALQVLNVEALALLGKFKRAHLVHVVRSFNSAADMIAGQALQRGSGETIPSDRFGDLEMLNRLHEVVGCIKGKPEVHCDQDDPQRTKQPMLTEARAGVVDSNTFVTREHEGERSAEAAVHVMTRTQRRAAAESPPQVPTSVDHQEFEGDVSHDAGPPPTADAPQSIGHSEGNDGAGAAEGTAVEGDGAAESVRCEADADRTNPAMVEAPTSNASQVDPDVVQLIRKERICRAQSEESWVKRLKAFLQGEVDGLDEKQVENCGKIACDYEVVDGLLYYVGQAKSHDGQESEPCLRLVVPTTLVEEVLRHFHTSLAGGHQGVSRTYEKVRRFLYWRGQYVDVRNYVAACPDCQSGKGNPRLSGTSPGNVKATRPFEVVGMDHVPSLPRSFRGNTELLVWIDHHSGFLIVSANPSREAQVVAESYERCVYRRFGASEQIRHDREPAFMSEVFKAFNRLIGQRSRATLAYRPQANGTTERMVQTVMRAVRLYVSDPTQRDWDEYAERLVFAINSSFDRVRQEIPFYLVHGWVPRTTLETGLPIIDGERGHVQARRWRASTQALYRRARDDANRLVHEAIEERREAADRNERGNTSDITPGARVWLFINQVRPGYAKKLAHLWHGPFRVLERPADHLAKLEVDGIEYKFFPLVHVSRLKVWKEFTPRPCNELEVGECDRFDFDEALLPEDSFEPDNEGGDYEITEIIAHADDRVARQGRVVRQYLVRWLGWEDPGWVSEDDLNAPSLVMEYERRQRARGRFAVMDTQEE